MMGKSGSPPWGLEKRNGAALILAVVALAVFSGIMAGVIWQVMAQKRLLNQRQARMQADWLVRAGIEHAAAQILSMKKDFKEEILTPIPDSQVRVQIRPDPKETDTFHVLSEARFPADDPQGVVRIQTSRIRRSLDKDQVRIHVEAGTGP